MFTREGIIRHEVGHAIVAVRVGRNLRGIVWRKQKDGSIHGSVDLRPSEGDPHRLTILTAGLVADYLNNRMPSIDRKNNPLHPTFKDMLEWESDYWSSLVPRMVAQSDLIMIQKMINLAADDRDNISISIAPQEAVQLAIDILNEEWNELCRLVDYALTRRLGIGPRELQRFFSGKKLCRWARFADIPYVLLARLEQSRVRDGR